jgi:hypothetical protein
MRNLFILIILAALISSQPCLAQDGGLEDLPKGAIVLSFHLKVEIGGRTTEMAPKVATMNGKSAELEVFSDEGEEEYVRLTVTPRLEGDEKVSLDMLVTSRLAGHKIERKMRVVTLLGSESVYQVTDAKNKERLSLKVLPEKVR